MLVIETDDMRWDELRWMPNVRHLVQRRGLTFENSFAPYPLCCPSRASFLTGKYAHNHHVYSHLPPYGFASFRDRRTIATVLQKAGYRTALVGKYLNGYGQQRIRRTHRPSLNYVPPGWSQWWAGSDHLWRPGDAFHGNTYDYFNLVQNVNGRIVASNGRYSADVMAEQTRSLIRRFGRQPQPVVRLVDADRPAPRHAGRVRRPGDDAAHRRLLDHLGDAGAAGLGEGPVRRGDHARRGHPAHRLGRGGRRPTSRATCASCRS